MNLNEILNLRKKGLSVFPVSNETKVPLVKWERLQNELPTIQEVTEWFTPNNRSVGVATGKLSGLFVLDLDFRKHIEAKIWYEDNKADFPRTWVESTKSGGLHMYFKWVPELDTKKTNTVSDLWKGVDTRGEGGYSKMSPSEGYKWINSPTLTPLAEVPKWLVDLLPDRNEPKAPLAGSEKSFIQEILDDVKPGNRNDSFTRAAGSLRNRGYSSSDIYALLSPKAREVDFDLRELQLLTESVGRYKPSQQIEEVSANSIEEFLKDIEQVEWLCEPVVAKKTIGFVAGLPETMKTWIMIDLAVEVARPIIGVEQGLWLNKFSVGHGKVLFIDQERFKGETQRRFRAVIKAKNLNPKDLRESLFIRCGTTTRINLQQSYDAFRKELAEIRPDLVIIDSFAAFHTAEENNRQSIQDVLEKIKQLRSEFGCAFIFIHHENKFAFRGKEEDREPSIAEMSGSVAIPAVAEFVLTVRRQDSESSFIYHTKSTLASTISPFLVKVVDLDEKKSAIKVEAF